MLQIAKEFFTLYQLVSVFSFTIYIFMVVCRHLENVASKIIINIKQHEELELKSEYQEVVINKQSLDNIVGDDDNVEYVIINVDLNNKAV